MPLVVQAVPVQPARPAFNAGAAGRRARLAPATRPFLSMVRVDLHGSSIAGARDADSSAVVQRATSVRRRATPHTALPDLNAPQQARTKPAQRTIVSSSPLRLAQNIPPSRSVATGAEPQRLLPTVATPNTGQNSHPAFGTAPIATPAATPTAPQIAMTPPFLNPKRVEHPQTPAISINRGLTVPRNGKNRGDGRTLSSRSMSDRILLARLQADLVRARHRLNNASSDLSESERDLARFTNTLRQAMLEAGPDARGLHPFVKVAQRYAGTPYVWGGESARGFDCSGFIIRVMRDLGYRALPHSAAEQFTYGKPIAQALLKPGDLVFFANTYKPGISHVGIWLGRGRFIHAAGTGKGTIVSYLSASPYHQKYAGARRLIKGG